MNALVRRAAAASVATLTLAACSTETESPYSDITTAPIGSSAPSPSQTPTTVAAPQTPTPDPTAAPPAEVAVLEVGFVQNDADTVAWATIDNPTDQVLFGHVIFTAYDADDRVLTTQDSWYAGIRAGQSFGIAQSIHPQEGTTADHVEARWIEQRRETDPSPGSAFEVDSVDIFESYGSVSVTGTLTSTYADTVEGLNVFAICADDAGDIVTAGQGLVEFPVAANDTVPYTIEFMPMPMPSTCNVWASFGLSTVFG